MSWYPAVLSDLCTETGPAYDFVRDPVCQIVTTIRLLHEPGIVHAEMKPSNILFVEGDGGSYTLYLCDF
jgi:serine/threonine protein kinase